MHIVRCTLLDVMPLSQICPSILPVTTTGPDAKLPGQQP